MLLDTFKHEVHLNTILKIGGCCIETSLQLHIMLLILRIVFTI
jgi:hypothetical protein